MQRILRSTPATLEARFYPAGSDTPATDGTVTVTVTRADGTTVTGVGAVSEPDSGVYRATLPAQPDLDLLTATWEGDTQTVTTTAEIVGGFYCTLAEIRAQRNLDSAAKFPTAALEDARDWFETLAEDHCGCAFVPRFARHTFDGDGSTGLRLRLTSTSLARRPRPRPVRRVLAATIDGTSVAGGAVSGWDVYPDGTIDTYDATTVFTLGRRNVIVAWEYGYDQPPADLKSAALAAIRARLLADEARQYPERATSISNEFGNILLSQPGTNRPTGLPEVDAVLNRLNENTGPLVA